jgi:hypothetical protein
MRYVIIRRRGAFDLPMLGVAAVQAAFQLSKPLDNTDLTLSYRKTMVRMHVARVLGQLAGLPDAP